MKHGDLALLPTDLARSSISQDEIVLPLKEALHAIDALESQQVLILGWEAWVRDSAGRVSQASAPLGTISLESLTIPEAAAFCRQTIHLDATEWMTKNKGTTDELYFCITVRA